MTSEGLLNLLLSNTDRVDLDEADVLPAHTFNAQAVRDKGDLRGAEATQKQIRHPVVVGFRHHHHVYFRELALIHFRNREHTDPRLQVHIHGLTAAKPREGFCYTDGGFGVEGLISLCDISWSESCQCG